MGVGTVSNGVVAEGTAHEATAAAVFMMTVMAVAAVVSTNVAEWVRVGMWRYVFTLVCPIYTCADIES